MQNENHQKRLIVEGFTQNGLHHNFRHKKLYRLAPVKINFDDFGMY